MKCPYCNSSEGHSEYEGRRYCKTCQRLWPSMGNYVVVLGMHPDRDKEKRVG